MESQTYFVTIEFIRNADGDLIAEQARKQPSAGAAVSEARRMAKKSAGAVAFSRTGDPVRGEFDEVVVLCAFGEVPNLDEMFHHE